MIDLVALRNEIDADPLNLGFAARVAAGDDAGVADLLNAATGPGAATVELPSIPKSAFLKSLRPAYLSLPGLPAATQAKWDRILDAINNTDVVTVDATTRALLGQAVADGVLTQDQADGAWHRTGSRAEVLWGAGAAISPDDVAAAFGRY